MCDLQRIAENIDMLQNLRGPNLTGIPADNA